MVNAAVGHSKSFFYVCICKDPIIDQCFLRASTTAIPTSYFSPADDLDEEDLSIAIAKLAELCSPFISDYKHATRFSYYATINGVTGSQTMQPMVAEEQTLHKLSAMTPSVTLRPSVSAACCSLHYDALGLS